MARDDVILRAAFRQRPRALTWLCLLDGLLLLVGSATLLWSVCTAALGGLLTLEAVVLILCALRIAIAALAAVALGKAGAWRCLLALGPGSLVALVIRLLAGPAVAVEALGGWALALGWAWLHSGVACQQAVACWVQEMEQARVSLPVARRGAVEGRNV